MSLAFHVFYIVLSLRISRAIMSRLCVRVSHVKRRKRMYEMTFSKRSTISSTAIVDSDMCVKRMSLIDVLVLLLLLIYAMRCCAMRCCAVAIDASRCVNRQRELEDENHLILLNVAARANSWSTSRTDRSRPRSGIYINEHHIRNLRDWS